MVCLWHTMLVNNWEELKSSNYIRLLMETAILLLWHVVAGIVALARSATLMEVELLCGTTKGFTHSLMFPSRSEAPKCAVAGDQGAGQGWRQRLCLPTPHLQQAGNHSQASSWLSLCKNGCSQCQPDMPTPLGMDTKGTIPCPPRHRHPHLAFLSQEQTAPAPQSTAGGKRNHFMVNSLLSPVEGQEKQWLIFLEMCSEAVVVENLGHNKSSQCFLST